MKIVAYTNKSFKAFLCVFKFFCALDCPYVSFVISGHSRKFNFRNKLFLAQSHYTCNTNTFLLINETS